MKTFASLPSLATTVSVSGSLFFAAQLASCDISIFCGAGASPLRLTLPVTVPSLPVAAYLVPVDGPESPGPPELVASSFLPQATLSASSEAIIEIASQKPARFFNIIDSYNCKMNSRVPNETERSHHAKL